MATISITRDIVLSEEGKRIIREALADESEVPVPSFVRNSKITFTMGTPEMAAQLIERLKKKRKEMGLD